MGSNESDESDESDRPDEPDGSDESDDSDEPDADATFAPGHSLAVTTRWSSHLCRLEQSCSACTASFSGTYDESRMGWQCLKWSRLHWRTRLLEERISGEKMSLSQNLDFWNRERERDRC